MYLRFAERAGWRSEILDAEESDLGGYKKDVSVAVKSRVAPEVGTAPFARLKYEGGVHRVQRVPVTESQGRIHTSAAGVRWCFRRPATTTLPWRRSRRTTCGSTSTALPDPAARASTRPTRGAHRPPADRNRRLVPEREEPVAEQGTGHAHSAGPPAGGRPGGGRGGGVGRAAQPIRTVDRSSGSAPTTSPTTGSPTTGSGSRPTTSTPTPTATSTQ